jgi:hypothetical protein
VVVTIEEEEDVIAPRIKRCAVIASDSDSDDEEQPIRENRKRKVRSFAAAARQFLDLEAGVDGDASADEQDDEPNEDDRAFINDLSEDSEHENEPDYDSEFESDNDDDDNFDLEI